MTQLNQLSVVEKTDVAQGQQPAEMPLSPFGSIGAFESAQRMAKALSASTFIPHEFKNNVGDCLIIMETAARTGMPIMALLQNMHVIHGKPSFSSAFMAGLINNSKRFDGPIRFVYNKARTSCYAVTEKDGQEYRGITVTMKMAEQEGWLGKKGSKWKTMPELMLQYRATSFFARAYCGDLIMGMREQTELEDMDSGPEPEAVTSLNTVVTPTKAEQEKAIDVEAEEIEKKDLSEEVAKLMEEAKKNTTAATMDTWRAKNAKRIAKELPDEAVVAQFFKDVDDMYQLLKEMDAIKGETVTCPNTDEKVKVSECKGMSCSDGCPAL